MDPFTILAIGSGVASGVQGYQQGRQADRMNKKALEQAELEFGMRAPLRRQGMQALGQIEGAMDLGNIGFNASNPFAAARGPAQSTAKLGNWDQITTAPEVMDNAVMGVTDDDLAWAQDALTRKRDDGSWAYKASERNHAQKQIMDRASRNAGFAGMQPQLASRVTAAQGRNQQRGGFQPLGGPPPRPRTSPVDRRGIAPLGGFDE